MYGDNVLNNINTLLAKLKPSQYRKYWKIWNSKFRDRYRDIFGNKYRIYLDYPEDDVELVADRESAVNIKLINIILNDCPYTKDFEVKSVRDYIEGYAYSSDGSQKAKIGKLLNKALNYFEKENIPPEMYEFKDVVNNFNNRPSFKQSSKPKLVCISRHPYDIAGMSTDRRWRSCMSLGDKESYIPAGGMQYYIEEDIREGTLVAYLIYADDKNINDPLARILIKPYVNVEDPSDILLIPEPTIYSDNSLSPAAYREFREIVNDWLEAFQEEKTGVYKFHPNLYRDRSPETLTKVSKAEVEKLKQYGITVDKYSYDKTLADLTAKFPWLLDGKFINLQLHTAYPDEGDSTWLNIKRGTWKKGFMTKAILEPKVTVENGILYRCDHYGTFKNGVFCNGEFYGTFEGGVWLKGIFYKTAVWKGGEWVSGAVDVTFKDGSMMYYPSVLNPTIVRKIADESEDEDDFIRKYKKYKREFFGSEYNVDEHLKKFDSLYSKINRLIKKYERRM